MVPTRGRGPLLEDGQLVPDTNRYTVASVVAVFLGDDAGVVSGAAVPAYGRV